MSAVVKPGASPRLARTMPHGSTIIEWPQVARVLPAASAWQPGRRRGDHPALRFDGAGADQNLPMVAAGFRGERGGDENHLGALPPQGEEQFRKAKIIADRQAKPRVRRAGNDNLLAGAEQAAFAVARAARRGDVEQVDLAVARQLGAVRAEHKAGVEQRLAGQLADRAAVQDDAVGARGLRHERVGECRLAGLRPLRAWQRGRRRGSSTFPAG